MVLNRAKLKFLSLLFSLLFCTTTIAFQQQDSEEPQLKVVALFKRAAMIDFAGKQKLYREGQQISPDIQLIKADKRFATFKVKGKELKLGLDRAFGFNTRSMNKPEDKQEKGMRVARIVRNNQGMYKTGGFINGVAVPFLIDTGATTVAMSENFAKLVGLPYKIDGEKGMAYTASGTVPTWNVVLKKVRIGGVELTNVTAGVIKGEYPKDVLLGMSFLNRVKVEYDGPLLTLTKEY